MPKKSTHKKVATARHYKSFKLHGDYSSQQVLFYIVVDLIIGFVLGLMLQPTIVATLTSYASGGY